MKTISEASKTISMTSKRAREQAEYDVELWGGRRTENGLAAVSKSRLGWQESSSVITRPMCRRVNHFPWERGISTSLHSTADDISLGNARDCG
ncbi:hypothetical protein J6590_026656 [Homalodisca vitripennis]|nr:hypothetical protein J6590_026656 [Homalodisca vitripennis]